MILTTTHNVEGKTIDQYLGIVFGEVITGTDVIKDIGAGFKDIFGGRSKGYEETLIKTRKEALDEIQQRASELNADAIVGLKMDYETLGGNNSILMVTVSGTAVSFK